MLSKQATLSRGIEAETDAAKFFGERNVAGLSICRPTKWVERPRWVRFDALGVATWWGTRSYGRTECTRYRPRDGVRLVGLCTCAATSIVNPGRDDAHIVKRRAKAIPS